MSRSEAMRRRNLEYFSNPKNRQKHSKMMKKRYENLEARLTASRAAKRRYQDPEQRNKTAEATRKTWQDSEIKEKRIRAIKNGVRDVWTPEKRARQVIVGGFNKIRNKESKAENLFALMYPDLEQEVSFGTGKNGFDRWGTTRFVADFLDRNNNMIYELDGTIHNTPKRKASDKRKELFFKEKNILIIRLVNEVVYQMAEMAN